MSTISKSKEPVTGLRPEISAQIFDAHRQGKNVLLQAPLGSGRAQYFYLADALVGRKEQDRASIAASEALTLEQFWGGVAPTRNGPVWRDGALAAAMRAGHRILIHDVERLSARLRTLLIDKLEGRTGWQGEGQPALVAKAGFGIDATAVTAPDPELVAAFSLRINL